MRRKKIKNTVIGICYQTLLAIIRTVIIVGIVGITILTMMVFLGELELSILFFSIYALEMCFIIAIVMIKAKIEVIDMEKEYEHEMKNRERAYLDEISELKNKNWDTEDELDQLKWCLKN